MAASVHMESGRQWDLHRKLLTLLTDRGRRGLVSPAATMVENMTLRG